MADKQKNKQNSNVDRGRSEANKKSSVRLPGERVNGNNQTTTSTGPRGPRHEKK